MGHCRAFKVLHTGCEHLISQDSLCSKTANQQPIWKSPNLSTQEESQYGKEGMLREEEIVLICSIKHCSHAKYERHTHLFKGA